MKCLVTGGAGFIGSHLCEELLLRGDIVTVLDDLSTGSIDNILSLYQFSSFRFVKGSILDTTLLSTLMEGCDEVYHLASVVGVKLILNEPVHGIKVNSIGTELVFDCAEKFGCKVLFTSSSEVYGKGSIGNYHESASRIYGSADKLRWAYATAKAMSEFSAIARYKENNFPVVIARLFNTVGPRQSPEYGMVLPRLIRQALRGEPLTVYGSGKQTRSFIWVSDVVTALIDLLRNETTIGQIYNVGGTEEVTITHCANQVITATASESVIQYHDYEDVYPDGFEEVLHRCPDITKIAKAIGFRPTHSLDEIITGIIAIEPSALKRRYGS